MAENGMGRSNLDVDILKETLCAQQQLLQKLYNELDAEREASSSAASEALSMILRLQAEKAAVQMEAEQYKRLSEEKMGYAEQSLAIFEDIISQKEMELAALDYQVQAYRYKLLSMGCVDPGIGEFKYPENLLQRSESLVGEMNLQSIGRRNSAPVIPLKSSIKKGVTEKESSISPDTGLIQKMVEDCPGQQDTNDLSFDWEKKTDNSSAGGINSYWEQIRKLDDRVKEIAGVSYADLRSSTRSPSPLSQSSGNPYNATKGATENELDNNKHPGNLMESEITADCPCSPGVLDVFEVPRAEERYDDCQLKRKHQKKMVLLDEDKLQKPDSVPGESVKSSVQDEDDRIQTVLNSYHHQKAFCGPSNAGEVDCNLAFVQPITGVSISQPMLQKFNHTSEIVDIERQASTQASINREEELKLLKEIKEQLNSMESEIRSWRTKKSSPRDDLSYQMLTLTEAMLHFWL